MMYKELVLAFILASFTCNAVAQGQARAQESDQQISDFSLVGYAGKGKKNWDISGKSADIFDDVIKLKEVVGNLYGEKEDIKLTAERGDFDKAQGKVHLEENVIITTTTGAKLTTDSLDWDRKNQVVSTDELVNITKENMVTTARGATGRPNLNKIKLEKDVRVDIVPNPEKNPEEDAKNKIIITCDGPLEIDYAKNIATFKNNVKVDTQDNLIYSDVMDIHFLASDKESHPASDEESAQIMGAKIEKIVARGNVKIVRGQNVSYSEEAIYTAQDKRIVLTGKPKLIIYSKEGFSASFGD